MTQARTPKAPPPGQKRPWARLAARRTGAVLVAVAGLAAIAQLVHAESLPDASSWAERLLPAHLAQTPVREVVEALPFL